MENTNNTVVAKATSNADETIAAFQNESTPTQEVETAETQEVEETDRDEVVAELRAKEVAMQSYLGISETERVTVESIIANAFPETTEYSVKGINGGIDPIKKTEKYGSVALPMLKLTGENPRIADEAGYELENLANDILKNGLTNPIHVIENKPDITGIANQGTKAPFYIVLDGHRRLSAIEWLLLNNKIDVTHHLVTNVPVFKTTISWNKNNWRGRVTEYMLRQSEGVKSLHFVEYASSLAKVVKMATKSVNELSESLNAKPAKIRQLLDLIKLTENAPAAYAIIREKGHSLADAIAKLKDFNESFKKEKGFAPEVDDILIFLAGAKVSKKGRISEKNMTEAEKEQFEKDRLAKAQAEAQEANAKVAALSGNASQASQNSLSESTNSTSENEGSAESDVALTMEQKHNRAKIEGRMALFSENAPTILNEKLNQNLITQEQYDAAIVALNVVSNLNILVTTVLTKGKTFEEQVLDVLGITLPVQSDTENPDTI
jgi:ParB-like chromosome segregation protein Spo0J